MNKNVKIALIIGGVALAAFVIYKLTSGSKNIASDKNPTKFDQTKFGYDPNFGKGSSPIGRVTGTSNDTANPNVSSGTSSSAPTVR
jgi:hypothetical protein